MKEARYISRPGRGTSWPPRSAYVNLMKLPTNVIKADGRSRMLTILPRENATAFYNALARFDRTRKAAVAKDSQGQMAGRGEHYAFPDNSAQQLALIAKQRAWLRDYGRTREAQPNDYTLIPLSGESELELDWKPFYIETYGKYHGHPFMIEDIRELAREAWVYNRLIKICQFHGADHSIAMVLQLVKDRIPFDFLMHNDVPNEMPDELEYVKYAALHAFDMPLVITRLQNTAEEYLYMKALLMSDRARWCTNEWKIRPFKKFLRHFFFDLKQLDKLPDVKFVDCLQFLGMQVFQSPGRRGLNDLPTPSNISVPRATFWDSQPPGKRILRVFDALPVHKLSNEDDLALISKAGIMRDPNTLEMGRHGCLLCPYASLPYYLQLQDKYPTLFEICKRRVREGNRKSGTSFTFIDPARITTTYRNPPYNLTKPPL